MASDSNILVRLKLLGASGFAAAVRTSGAALDGLGNSGRGASGGLAATAGQANRTARALGRLKAAGVQAEGAIASVGAGTAAAAGYLARGGRMLAIAGGVAGAAVGTVGAKYNAMQDRQQVAFQTYLGNARRAQRFMRQLAQVAEDSPILDPRSTGRAAQSLMAYGIRGKKVLPFIKAMGDMSAASGKSIAEAMPMGARAIGQIASKGKLSMEELNQLAEGIGLSQNAIRKQLGMTRDEFASTFTPGNQIQASKALPAILKAMRSEAGGAAKLAAQNTEGRVDRLKEVGSRAIAGFTRPIYDEVGLLATSIADRLKGVNLEKAGKATMRTIKTIVGAAKSAAPTVIAIARRVVDTATKIGRGAVDVVGKVIDALKPAAPFVSNVLLPLLKGIAKGVIGGLVATFKIAVPVVKAIATGLGFVGRVLKPLKGVIEGVGTVIGILFGPGLLGRAAGVLGRVGSAIGGKLGGALRIAGVAFKVATLPARILIRVLGLGGRAVAALSRGFMRGVTFAGRYVATFTGPLRKAVLGAVNLLRSAGGRIGDIVGKIGKVLGKVPDAFRRAFRGLGGFVGGIMSGVKGAVVSALNWAIDKINWLIRSFNNTAGRIPGVSNIGQLDRIDPGEAGRAAARGLRHVTPTQTTSSPGTGGPTGNGTGRRHSLAGGMFANRAIAAGFSSPGTQPIVIDNTLMLEREPIHRSVIRHDAIVDERS